MNERFADHDPRRERNPRAPSPEGSYKTGFGWARGSEQYDSDTDYGAPLSKSPKKRRRHIDGKETRVPQAVRHYYEKEDEDQPVVRVRLHDFQRDSDDVLATKAGDGRYYDALEDALYGKAGPRYGYYDEQDALRRYDDAAPTRASKRGYGRYEDMDPPQNNQRHRKDDLDARSARADRQYDRIYGDAGGARVTRRHREVDDDAGPARVTRRHREIEDDAGPARVGQRHEYMEDDALHLEREDDARAAKAGQYSRGYDDYVRDREREDDARAAKAGRRHEYMEDDAIHLETEDDARAAKVGQRSRGYDDYTRHREIDDDARAARVSQRHRERDAGDSARDRREADPRIHHLGEKTVHTGVVNPISDSQKAFWRAKIKKRLSAHRVQ
jgi:hypothetical protein